ncbi:HNH endonuclease signature motif containing protein [Sphingomonas echinoides]|uniref:HNH endonuclease signature motif containing protein n=2 Tax=Sphingomonas echinoides TaxID=59803 RepID=A0ABU4PLZ5_9SPHN|nr:HNH endonuclease signature motif containing protein [Sphingomonas echinoides]MDX5984685.1 HNH endonuclease signature motif containing protein [Sphingomonas echinoides]
MCLGLGRVTEATRVDHIKPLDHGGSDEDSNTRNLCQPHHLEVTAEQFGHQVAAGMRGVARNGRPIGLDHAWNRSGPIRAARAPPRLPTPPGGRK